MLEKFRETAIMWDKANRKVYESLRASAGDNKGRKLSVQLVNDGVIEDLSGASLSLFWETKDKAYKGLDAFTAVDATKGEFEIFYTTGMLSNEGTLNANLVLVDTSGRVVSEPFTITVFKGIDDDAIQSSDSFTALTEALAQVGTINNKADRDELLALESTFEQNKNEVTAQLQHNAKQIDEIGISVTSFGAVGDGVANDTVAFQQAFAIEGAKNILIPDGQYYIDDTIIINDDTTVTFIGTVLERVNGKPLFYGLSRENIKFLYPKVVGVGAGTNFIVGQETIRFDYCNNVGSIGGNFKEISGRNAILFFNCEDVSATGNYIDKYSYGGISCLQGCVNVHIHNNKVLNCTNETTANIYPIMLSGYDGSVEGYPIAENIWCSGNYVDNLTPYWEGIDAHGGKNMHIYNNTVKGSFTGIAVLSESSNTWYIKDVFIHDNYCIAPSTGNVRNISNNGIVITGASDINVNAHIHDNTIDGFGKLTSSSTDLGSLKMNNVKGANIHDNKFVNSKTYGCRITGGCKDIRLKNNIFDGIEGESAYGIYFDNTAHEASIESNVFRNMTNVLRKPVSSSDPANTLIKLKDNDIASGVTYNPVGLYTLPDRMNGKPDSVGCKVGKVGDIVFNSEPSIGEDIGWICTVAGDGVTAGTWASMGAVA